MKIESLITKSGQTIELGKISVFVGPNNSGKSQTLRDILNIMEQGMDYVPVLFDQVNFEMPKTSTEAFDGINHFDSVTSIGDIVSREIVADLLTRMDLSFSKEGVEHSFVNNDIVSLMLGNLAKYKVAYLNSKTRLQLVEETKGFNPHEDDPGNILQRLLKDKESEILLNSAFKKAFDMEIRLDYSSFVTLCLKVANVMPEIPEDPRKAYPITKGLNNIDAQGDGFKSFAGIILGLLLTKNRIILLDEPEAFLHPAQARFLGQWISKNLDKFSGQILISTHNANFLSGVVSGDRSVDIFRLNRHGNDTQFNKVPPEATNQLSKHPLLSSQRVMEAIFHRGVIVCEADADRAIYHGVASIEMGNQEILFVHAHNKQTLKDVVDLMVKAKIPVAAIADIDLLNTEDDFDNIIQSFTGKKMESPLRNLRNKIASSVNATSDAEILVRIKESTLEFGEQLKEGMHTLAGAKGALNRLKRGTTQWSDAKERGVIGFDPAIQDDVRELLEICNGIGLFIVPVGELEGWINLEARKNRWVVPALHQIYAGESPENLKEFVDQILKFLDTDKDLAGEVATRMNKSVSSDVSDERSTEKAAGEN
ncbi:ATP-dependent nuclease [Olivibacter domesticus]|uniref:ATPase/GTPase, AAA15 family n=1 Tax=Olivibacter domesticus TaxID=407022 RepID=A0A1H7WP42_OLID1|nr:AAA family ATPase [Olivibacter domesticus]SEM23346.1 ATPase/GTPase, AAA15 family [Olivibacter domesticus]